MIHFELYIRIARHQHNLIYTRMQSRCNCAYKHPGATCWLTPVPAHLSGRINNVGLAGRALREWELSKRNRASSISLYTLFATEKIQTAMRDTFKTIKR